MTGLSGAGLLELVCLIVTALAIGALAEAWTAYSRERADRAVAVDRLILMTRRAEAAEQIIRNNTRPPASAPRGRTQQQREQDQAINIGNSG